VNKQKKQKTMKLSLILSLTLSIAIIIIISYFTFNEETIESLKGIKFRYEFFITAIAFNFIYWMMWGIRLRVLSNSIDKKVQIGVWESTKIIIANLFLANITPSMAGGEPVRIYLLNKNGLSIGDSTAAVLGERLLDAIFLLLCVPFAFWILRNSIQTGLLKNALTLAIIAFIVGVILFVYAIKSPERVKSILIWFSNKLRRFSKKKESKHSVVKKISSEVDNFHNSMTFFVKDGKIAFLKAFILTGVFWAVGWVIPILILMGLGLELNEIPIIESCAAQVLLIIIVMIPTTPGSAGVTEGGIYGLYGVFIPGNITTVFMIVFRILTYYVGLIAGAIFQYRIFKSVASFSLESLKKEKRT